jgi:hypothetical protein
MNAIKAQALEAHHRGETWAAFWQQHADTIRKAEPWNRQRFKRLVDRLLHLLTTGEPSGQEPPAIAEPWERDDAQAQAPISDTTTAARCLWPGRSTQEVTR